MFVFCDNFLGFGFDVIQFYLEFVEGLFVVIAESSFGLDQLDLLFVQLCIILVYEVFLDQQ